MLMVASQTISQRFAKTHCASVWIEMTYHHGMPTLSLLDLWRASTRLYQLMKRICSACYCVEKRISIVGSRPPRAKRL